MRIESVFFQSELERAPVRRRVRKAAATQQPAASFGECIEYFMYNHQYPKPLPRRRGPMGGGGCAPPVAVMPPTNNMATQGAANADILHKDTIGATSGRKLK